MHGLDRARRDLDEGRTRKARDRLKGVLSSRPDDLQARQLLAEACRQDRQWAEAGRWGYLVGTHAEWRERQAFERHVTCGCADGLTRQRLRHLLKVTDLGTIADARGQVIVSRLRISPTTARGWHPGSPSVRDTGRSRHVLKRLESWLVAWRMRRGDTVQATIDADLVGRLGRLLESYRPHPADDSACDVLRFTPLSVEPGCARYELTYRFGDHEPKSVTGAVDRQDLEANGSVEGIASIIYNDLTERETALP